MKRLIITAGLCLLLGIVLLGMLSCKDIGVTYTNKTAQQNSISITYPDGGTFQITIPADLDTKALIALQTQLANMLNTQVGNEYILNVDRVEHAHT